jgi:hypothetical protein
MNINDVRCKKILILQKVFKATIQQATFDAGHVYLSWNIE